MSSRIYAAVVFPTSAGEKENEKEKRWRANRQDGGRYGGESGKESRRIWKGRIQISKENLLLELDHLTMFCGKGQLATLKEQSE